MQTLLISFICVLFAQSWAAVLQTNDQQRQINQLQSADYGKQQQLPLVPLNETATFEQHKLPHQSYDFHDDVVSIDIQDNDDDVHDDESHDVPMQSLHVRQRRELADWLIAPNTRWCGRGNTANGTYNHLGGASSADKCCRKHDHCQLFIAGMSNRYELFNYRPYTLSHCNCDRRFRTCLKMANDEDARTIGKLFFNMVQTQCFILRNERVCQQRAADGSCEREFVKQKAYLRNNKKF